MDPRIKRTLAMIDAVLNEWSAAFEGTPEAQMEALEALADLRGEVIARAEVGIIDYDALADIADIERAPAKAWRIAALKAMRRRL